MHGGFLFYIRAFSAWNKRYKLYEKTGMKEEGLWWSYKYGNINLIESSYKTEKYLKMES